MFNILFLAGGGTGRIAPDRGRAGHVRQASGEPDAHDWQAAATGSAGATRTAAAECRTGKLSHTGVTKPQQSCHQRQVSAGNDLTMNAVNFHIK